MSPLYFSKFFYKFPIANRLAFLIAAMWSRTTALLILSIL